MTAIPACEPHTTVADALTCALDVLKDPTHWIKDDFGKTTKGRTLDRNDIQERDWEGEEAPVAFCLIGAIEYCAPGYVAEEALDELVHAITTVFTETDPTLAALVAENLIETDDIAWFNDLGKTTHEHVIQVLRYAIEHAPKEVPV